MWLRSGAIVSFISFINNYFFVRLLSVVLFLLFYELYLLLFADSVGIVKRMHLSDRSDSEAVLRRCF